MTDALFKNRYRPKTIRLPRHNYGRVGMYFVTICTHQRSHYFGQVVGDRVVLSAIGQIAHDNWQAIPNHHHRYVALDAFVIMPNHMHGLIQITKLSENPDQGQATVNRFGPLQKGSLQAIVQSYKASVTRACRRKGNNDFKWQPRFYEHVVRHNGSLNRIRQYIVNNPRKWSLDRNNSLGLWM
ncbi:MAG: transposase [Cyanobacteria bacterium P01_F01_bin.86]